MDTAYVSAISALAGSVILTSGFTTWLSQRSQARQAWPRMSCRWYGDSVDEIARHSREAADAPGCGPGCSIRKVDNFLQSQAEI
jgi:hypothetical protein